MRRPSQIIVLIAGAIALAPLLAGIPSGDDWPIELVRVQEYQQAWAGGDVLPTWAPEVLNGFGARDFMFFPPMFPAMAAGFATLTGSVGAGVVLALVAAAVFSMWAMHRASASAASLLGLDNPLVAADVAAAAYGLAPFILFDRIVRNSFAEITALAIVPLGIWAFCCSKDRPLAAGVLAALTAAGLTLSHVLSVFIGGATLLIVALILGLRRVSWTPLFIGLMAGLSMSAWFWLPMWSNLGSVRRGELIDYGLAAASNMMPIGDQLWPGSLAIGPGPWIIALTTLVLVIRPTSGVVRRLALTSLALALVTTVLVDPLSRGIWEIDPLPIVQFPWRLWAMHAVIGSLAIGLATSNLGELAPVVRIALIAVMLAAAAVPLSRVASVPGSWTEDVTDLIATADFPYQSTIGFEYVPPDGGLGVWLSHDSDNGPVIEAIGGRVTVVADEPFRIELAIDSNEPVGVFLAVWDIPEWQVRGDATRFTADGQTLGLGIPAETSSVVIEYEAPALRRSLERATPAIAAAWMLLAFVIARRRKIPS